MLGLLDTGLSLIESQKNLGKDLSWQRNKQSLQEKARQEPTLTTLRPYLEEALKKAGLSGVYLEPTLLGKKIPPPKPIAHILEGNVGYLYLPNLEGSPLQSKIFYRTLEPLIKRFAQRKLSGWIIDVRDTSGYDVPGLLQAASLMFVPSDKKLFLIRDDLKEELYLPMTTPPLVSTETPVALLQGQGTRLSGECLLAALAARPHTKTFGQPTPGTPYILVTHEMAPGYSLLLKDGSLCLEGKKGPLVPQTLVEENESSQDQTLFAALQWIEEVNRPQVPPEEGPS